MPRLIIGRFRSPTAALCLKERNERVANEILDLSHGEGLSYRETGAFLVEAG